MTKRPSSAPAAGEQIVPGEVIVRFKPGASSAQRSQARVLANASFRRNLLLSRTELVKVAKGKETEAAAALSRNPNVAFAEPNRILHALATPNDGRFGSLWGLNNSAQAVNGVVGLADADIDAPEGWNTGRGLGATVRVADIDTGVAMNHPDLTANIFTNPGESGGGKETNGIDDDGNGKVDDVHGWDFVNGDNNPSDDNAHGTHVAGTIAGRSNNSLGVAGVASFPTAAGPWLGPKIVPIKVLAANGSGFTSTVADGIVYAGTIGAKVANLSLGAPGTSTTLDTAIKSKPNTLYVVAAGNDGVNNDTSPHSPCVPATLPDAVNKICVAATDSNDQLASFSNFGVTHVDVAAPGVTILSTLPTKTTFSDTFEIALAGRWTTNDAGQTGTPRWGLSTNFATSPTHSITDSPAGNYENNQDNWARNTSGFNLTGGTGCQVFLQAKVDTETGFDFFDVEATRTPGVPASWQNMFHFSGVGQGAVEANIPAAFNNTTGVFVRLRMSSDGSVNHDGVYVDDFRVQCFFTTFDATSYAFFNGTSMATPHVAGAAAFLATKFPAAAPTLIKSKIMRSADRKPQLNGKLVSGARLNLYKAASESAAGVSGGILTWTASAGEKNNVTVTRFTDGDSIVKYRITDPYSTGTGVPQSGSRINPGAGCVAVNDNTVKCPAAGITRIVLNGGDLSDALNTSTILIPVTLNGGDGDDVLTGGTVGDILNGGLGLDTFVAGTGNDTINARNEDVDPSFNCGENLGDTDTVNADLAPNDPITANPANCEVVTKL